jgi:hypothetical protein
MRIRIIFFLLVSTIADIAGCQSVVDRCPYDAQCKADKFHRVDWYTADGEIETYLPPFQPGQKISFVVLFRASWPGASLSDYALSWGDRKYPLANKTVVLTTKEFENVFCLERMDGKRVEADFGERVDACRHIRNYISYSPVFTSSSETAQFDAPVLFELFQFPFDEEVASQYFLPMTGPFDGDLTNTRIEIQGHSPSILSESPSQALIAVDRPGLATTLKDAALGKSAITLREESREARLPIRFYAVKAKAIPSGGSAKGYIQISLFGLAQPPEMGLSFVFRPYIPVDVQTSANVRKLNPRAVRHLPNSANLPESTLRYIVAVTNATPISDAQGYELHVPIKARDTSAWHSGPVLEGSLVQLPDPERVRASVAAEMDRWQAANQVSVAPAIQKEIAGDFESQNDELHELWQSFQREVPSFNDFVRYVTAAYLYALRDAPVAAEQTAPALMKRFLSTDEKAGRALISQRTLSLLQFLKQNLLNVLFNDAVYIVETKPDGLLISEPGQQPSGVKTNGEMQFSLGPHDLEFYSPSLGKCSCPFQVQVAGPGSIQCDLSSGTPTSNFQCKVFP